MTEHSHFRQTDFFPAQQGVGALWMSAMLPWPVPHELRLSLQYLVRDDDRARCLIARFMQE